MGHFRQIQTSGTYSLNAQGPWELTLVGGSGSSPLIPTSQSAASGQWFAKASTSNTIGQQPDRASYRRQSSEASALFAGLSKSLSKATGLSTAQSTPNSSKLESYAGEKGKTWSKLTHKSRRWYKLVSGGGSSNALCEQHRSIPQDAPPPPLVENRSSSTLGSSCTTSPVTPNPGHHPLDIPAGLALRAPSASALAKWAEALSCSIRSKSGADTSMMPPILLEKRRTRPALSSVPGLRPLSFNGATLFPSDDGVEPHAHAKDASRPSSRQSHEAFSSMHQKLRRPSTQDSFTLPTSELFRRRQRRALHKSADLSDIMHSSGNETSSRPSTASGHSHSAWRLGSSASRPAHSRPNSIADVLSLGRRESTSSSMEASGAATRSSGVRRSSTSMVLDTLLDSQKSPGQDKDCSMPSRADALNGQVLSSPQSAATVQTRHRRSGSLLSRSSMRKIFDAATPASEAATGLGLELDCTPMTPSSEPAARDKKGFAKLRSLGVRPSSRSGRSDTLQDMNGVKGKVSAQASPRIGATETGANRSRSPLLDHGSLKPTNHRGVPRATSLLNLSKFAFGSTREKSPAQVPVGLAFEPKSRSPSLSCSTPLMQSRVEPEGCDFSYEFVDEENKRIASTVRPDSRTSVLSASGTLGSRSKDSTMLSVNNLSIRDGPGKKEARKRALTSSPREEIKELAAEPIRCASPPVVERILPPEQIIATFDRLRESQPTGIERGRSSYDTLGSMDMSMERSARPLPNRRPAANSRTAPCEDRKQPTDEQSVEDVGRATDAAVLDECKPTGLVASASTFALEGLQSGETVRPFAPRLGSLDSSDLRLRQSISMGTPLRSLPAPPRSSKRTKMPLAAVSKDSNGASLRPLRHFRSSTGLACSNSFNSLFNTEMEVTCSGSDDSTVDSVGKQPSPARDSSPRNSRSASVGVNSCEPPVWVPGLAGDGTKRQRASNAARVDENASPRRKYERDTSVGKVTSGPELENHLSTLSISSRRAVVLGERN